MRVSFVIHIWLLYTMPHMVEGVKCLFQTYFIGILTHFLGLYLYDQIMSKGPISYTINMGIHISTFLNSFTMILKYEKMDHNISLVLIFSSFTLLVLQWPLWHKLSMLVTYSSILLLILYIFLPFVLWDILFTLYFNTSRPHFYFLSRCSVHFLQK